MVQPSGLLAACRCRRPGGLAGQQALLGWQG